MLLTISVQVIAQQKFTINLTRSTRTVTVSPELTKVYNGTFVQKYSVLTSDSAYIYPKTNTFDAFGHVVITQGDTLHVYSDKLNYDDNTKVALLTENVKMVDKDATLTTNWLNYNTATKVGTYVDGGKIVNKDNTLTSRNGYYYAGSRDVYFRYDVVTNGPDALIRTDTMRYNSGTKITYFYGPTRIFGKKDKDTLYTENGTYNTKTEQAFFGKRNRYSQGTKSLKGDSLFYDKLKGYGKAIKNITFEDTEQRMILKGDLGEYFRKEEKAVVTQNPYVIIISEENDTTKKVISVTPPANATPKTGNDIAGKVDNAVRLLPQIPMVGDTELKKNLPPGKADSLAKVVAAQPAVKGAMPLANKAVDSLKKVAAKAAAGQVPAISKKQKDSLLKGATKAAPQIIGNFGAMPKVPLPVNKPVDIKKTAAANVAAAQAANNKAAAKTTTPKAPPRIADPVYIGPDLHLNAPKPDTGRRIKRDTMYIGADTLETQIITYKALKDLKEQRRLAGVVDTTKKLKAPFVPYTLKTLPKVLEVIKPKVPYLEYPAYKNRPLPNVVKRPVDTIVKPAPKPAPVPAKAAVKPADKAKQAAADSLKAKLKADSIAKAKPELADTARVRILSAHHHVQIFKSDLQGKSDSLFYSSSDSIIRSFVKPMYWTQGAQLSGDTINLQLKNKKADYMDVFPKGFVVYIEKQDSVHFNQIGGKRIEAWFKDNKISRIFVTGNGETVYFNRKEKTNTVTEMGRSISSTINFNFKNGELANMTFAKKVDQYMNPIKDVKEEDKLLKNFIWKPKDRPASKEDVIHPKRPVVPKKEALKKATDPAAKPGAKGTSADKKADGKAPAKDATGKPLTTKPAAGDSVKATGKSLSPAGKDSVTIPAPKPTTTGKPDTVSKAKPDSLKKVPEVKSPKDTTTKKP